MAKQIQYFHLEINQKQINLLKRKQLAYLVDTKQFVYCDCNGEYVYFNDVPKLREAINDSVIRTCHEQE